MEKAVAETVWEGGPTGRSGEQGGGRNCVVICGGHEGGVGFGDARMTGAE